MDIYTAGQKRFAQDLNDGLLKLTDAYKNLLLAAKVGDDADADVQGIQLSVQASNMVAATHRLVDLVTEIKLSQVTSNLEETNDLIEARSNMYAARKNEAKAKLDKLRAELDDASAELEFHYMNSRCR